MALHDVAESSFGRAVGALSLLAVRQILHLQHENLELSAGVHDEHRGQTADADGVRVDNVSGQSLHELHNLEGRAVPRVKEATVDWERVQPHRLIVDDVGSLREEWHQCGVEQATGVHEDRADDGQPPAEPGAVEHNFSVPFVTRPDVTPVRMNMPNALADVLVASDDDVMLHRGHQEETERTDHTDLAVEIGGHQERAERAWDQQETYQEATV